MKVDDKSIHYVGNPSITLGNEKAPIRGGLDLWISCTFNSISSLENNNFALAVDIVT